MNYCTNLVIKMYIEFTARIFFLFFPELSFILFGSLYIYSPYYLDNEISNFESYIYFDSYLIRTNYLSQNVKIYVKRDGSFIANRTLVFYQVISIHFPISRIYRYIWTTDTLISLASETFNSSFISTNAFRSRNWDVPWDRHYLFTSPFRQIGNRREGERKKSRALRQKFEGERGPFVCRIVHIYRS